MGRIDAHGAEFQDLEILLVDAHPLLPEQDRPRRVELDGKAEDEQQRREDDHAAQRQDDRQQPLDSVSIHGGSSFIQSTSYYTKASDNLQFIPRSFPKAQNAGFVDMILLVFSLVPGGILLYHNDEEQ